MSEQQRPPGRQRPTQPATPAQLLPSIGDLERLDRIIPNGAERTFAQMERQLEHQRRMESDGMRNAIIVSLVALIGSFIVVIVCALLHQSTAALAGGAVGVVDVVALAVAFITVGRSQR